MQNLIVLGLIPGTDIQINFLGWIILTAIVAFVASGWLLRHARIIRTWLVITWILFATHKAPALKRLYF